MDENSTKFVHGKLILCGNMFAKSSLGTHALHLEYLREAEITDNVFDAPYKINTHCVGTVTDKENKILGF